MNTLARLGYWAGTALAIVAYAALALSAAAALTACGGGDIEDDEPTCLVDGKPMPPHACR